MTDDPYDRYIESMRSEGLLDEGRDQHVVKVVFRDFVPDNHMRDLIRHAVAEFGLEVVEECEWRDPEDRYHAIDLPGA